MACSGPLLGVGSAGIRREVQMVAHLDLRWLGHVHHLLHDICVIHFETLILRFLMLCSHRNECANLERVRNILVAGTCKGSWSALLVKDFLRLVTRPSVTIRLHHDCSRLCRSHFVHRARSPSHNGTLIVLFPLILHHKR